MPGNQSPRRRFLVIGSDGQLGRAFVKQFGNSGIGADLPEIDVTDVKSVDALVQKVQPEWIINCSAITDVDLCEREPKQAYAVHHRGVAHLAETGIKLLTFSTDHIFSGDSDRDTPFYESDAPDPVNIYAASKLAGEEAALSAQNENLVIRTSWLFSDTNGLIPFLWNALKSNGTVRAVSDQVSAISYANDLVEQALAAIDDGVSGILHITGSEESTPAGLARMITDYTGGTVEALLWESLGRDARRPRYSVLSSRRGYMLGSTADTIERWKETNG